MSASMNELEQALAEGVELYESLSPKSFEGGHLTCYQTQPDDPNDSVRCRPVLTDKIVEIPADTVIAAVGNKSSVGFIDENAKDVYVIGAAANRTFTITEAVDDAKKCASVIIS